MPDKTRPYELKQVEARVYLGQAGALYSKVPVTNPEAAVDVIREAMSQYDREYFSVLSLNNRNEVLNYSVVSIGSASETIVQTSKVFLPAILSGGTNIIAFHCHPSGDTSPSEADKSVTQNLVEAGRILGINLLDHMIIGGGSEAYYSFRAHDPGMFAEPEITVAAEIVEETNKKAYTSYSLKMENETTDKRKTVKEVDRSVSDPQEIVLSKEPFYQHCFSYAMEHDEIPAWRASYHEDMRLKHMIQDLVHEHYDGQRLDTKKIMDAVGKEFSGERINALTAFTVNYLAYDGRFSDNVKAWALRNCPEAEDNVFGRDPRTDLLINVHPGLLNLLIEQIIIKENIPMEQKITEEKQRHQEDNLQDDTRQKQNEYGVRRNIGLLLMVMFVLITVLPAVSTNAASGLKQIDATKHSAVISFSGGDSGVSVYISTSPNGMYADWTRHSGVSFGKIEVSGLMDGSTYYVKLRERSRMSPPCEIVTVPAGSVVMVRQIDAGKDSITARWNAVSHVNGYSVALLGTGSESLKEKFSSRNTVTIKVPDHNNKYAIRITPVRRGKTFTAEGVALTSKRDLMAVPGKVKNVSFQKNCLRNHKASFSWEGSSVVSGYECEVSSYDGLRLFTKGTGKTAVTLKNRLLKMNRYYRIRVRGYVSIENGVRYGGWSKKIFFSGGPAKVRLKQSTGILKVSWSKVDGASSYSVYVATSAPRKLSVMKRAKTVAGTSCTITKFRGNAISADGTYYVTVVSNKKVGKKIYKSKPTTYYYIG